jgi:lipopolysaccharide biosynthesis glycosyltransferase
MKKSIWIGFDPREADAFAVCRSSIRDRLTQPIPVHGIILEDLINKGWYPRGIGVDREGRMYDPISEAPMSTQFAISRFFVPLLSSEGWALFMDCDMLVRTNLTRLFEQLDKKYAVYCVKHNHVPDASIKMDNQIQTRYARKNWSSVMVFNCDHESNKKLTVSALNSLPGRDLHRFCWLEDDEIGALGPEWNYLVGETKADVDPCIVHFTSGGPWMHGYERVEYAGEWREELMRWAR